MNRNKYLILNEKSRMSNISVKTNKIQSIILLLFLFLSLKAIAQNKITLSQAINKGLENKKNISAGKLDRIISTLQTQALYRKYWPQVSVEYNYVYNPILQTSILPIGIFNPNDYLPDAKKSVQFGTKWTQSAGLTLIQPLLDFTIQRNIKESKIKEQIANLSQELTENELVYSIAQVYIDISLQNAQIKAVIADTCRTYASYNLLKDKFLEKRLLKSELNKSKINHNNAVQHLSDEITQLIENKINLLFLMGDLNLEKSNFVIDSNLEMNSIFTNIENQPVSIQLLDIQTLELQSKISILKVSSEKAKLLPVISFKGFIGANQYTNTFSPLANNTWFGVSYVGLNIMFPLLLGESTYNKLQELKLQNNQYKLQKEDKAFQYTKDALTTKLKIDNLKTQLKTQQENIELSAETIHIYQDRLLSGQDTAANLNIEEASLQILKANYDTNTKQLWVYSIDYLKTSGQLSFLWKLQ